MGADKYNASGKTDYETPQNLFEEWNRIFQFNLDAAANCDNCKLNQYISPELDAFEENWYCPDSSLPARTKGRVWLNPPYGRGIDKWIRRAIEQVKGGYAEFVLMLLPSNTDTKWFHNLCKQGKIKFLPSRITFVGEENPMKNGSMLVLFGEDPTNGAFEWDMEKKMLLPESIWRHYNISEEVKK